MSPLSLIALDRFRPVLRHRDRVRGEYSTSLSVGASQLRHAADRELDAALAGSVCSGLTFWSHSARASTPGDRHWRTTTTARGTFRNQPRDEKSQTGMITNLNPVKLPFPAAADAGRAARDGVGHHVQLLRRHHHGGPQRLDLLQQDGRARYGVLDPTTPQAPGAPSITADPPIHRG